MDLVAIVLVGVIGLMIIMDSTPKKTFQDIIKMEEFGYLLLGFAVCVGLMYIITPISIVKMPPPAIRGGSSCKTKRNYEEGSALDAITGGYLHKDVDNVLSTTHLVRDNYD